ncbi:MAG: hypothetical protein RL722_1624 [Pseudomonadota bacterium]|jgi:uncharacterized ferritin-like protein (DUF455 family)
MTGATERATSLRAQALAIVTEADPGRKAALALALRPDQGEVDAQAVLVEPPGLPGRPARPPLVPQAGLSPRSVGTREGRAALLHALAHIEFNAIDLAADIVWRFPGLPEVFYRQWLGVAREEALHFSLLREHLQQSLAHDYGDFPAHNALWDMAERTRGDLLARLALVPRTLEARGLDAAPPIRDRLISVGDHRAGEILALILRDEVGHVALGNHWYRWLCQARGLNPVAAYAELAARHGAPRLRGPFNLEARRLAGFEEAELAALQAPGFTAVGSNS